MSDWIGYLILGVCVVLAASVLAGAASFATVWSIIVSIAWIIAVVIIGIFAFIALIIGIYVWKG
jgi:hypothetical protein